MFLMWVKALIKAMRGPGGEMRVVIKSNKVYILQERQLWLQLYDITELCLKSPPSAP